MRIRCTEELHDHGGPGRFLLARAEDALDGLLAEYEGRATLIYLDPPSGAGDTFHLCLGRGQKPLALPVSDVRLDEAACLAWMRVVLAGCRRLLGRLLASLFGGVRHLFCALSIVVGAVAHLPFVGLCHFFTSSMSSRRKRLYF